jgi:hypothetical protein
MIEPMEFLAEAKALNDDETCEARRRTVISRAYYGVYHHVLRQDWLRDFATDLAWSQKKARDENRSPPSLHTALVRWMGRNSNRKISQAGADLGDLLARRNKADYDLKLSIDAGYAADSLGLADAILTRLGTVGDGDHTRS